jgi:hypothetical protein
MGLIGSLLVLCFPSLQYSITPSCLILGLQLPKWSPTGKPVVPTKVPVFAFGYDAVIRLSFGATSRRSILIVCAFIHGQARGLLRRRIKCYNVNRLYKFRDVVLSE